MCLGLSQVGIGANCTAGKTGYVNTKDTLGRRTATATAKALLVEGSGMRCSKIIKVHILYLASLHLSM